MRRQLEETTTPEKEFAEEFVTPCYLCHGQCASSGAQGKAGRPCAKGVSDLLQRRRQKRSRAGSAH